MSTGIRSSRGPLPGRQCQARGGHQRQRDHGRDHRPDDRPDRQRLVGAEPPEPPESVDRGDGIAGGERVVDGLRRKGHLEERASRHLAPPTPKEFILHTGEADERRSLGDDGRDRPPPLEVLQRLRNTRELVGVGAQRPDGHDHDSDGEHVPQDRPHPAERRPLCLESIRAVWFAHDRSHEPEGTWPGPEDVVVGAGIGLVC